MALRAGYYGIKKKILEKVNALPGIKTIGTGLSLSSAGVLSTDGSGVVDYSTNEQDTGIKWLDGKAIYQKSYTMQLPNATVTSVPIGADIDIVIKMEGFALDNSKNVLPLPSVNVTDVALGIASYVSSTGLLAIVTGSDRSDYTGYITLYYTKTS